MNPVRILRRVVGWALVVAGVAGLFLPFLQGLLFLALGLGLLSTESRWAGEVLERVKRRLGRRSVGDQGNARRSDGAADPD